MYSVKMAAVGHNQRLPCLRASKGAERFFATGPGHMILPSAERVGGVTRDFDGWLHGTDLTEAGWMAEVKCRLPEAGWVDSRTAGFQCLHSKPDVLQRPTTQRTDSQDCGSTNCRRLLYRNSSVFESSNCTHSSSTSFALHMATLPTGASGPRPSSRLHS